MSRRDEGQARFVAVDFAPIGGRPRRGSQLPILESAFVLVVAAWLFLAVTHLLLR